MHRQQHKYTSAGPACFIALMIRQGRIKDAEYHLEFGGRTASNCDLQLTDADDDRLRMPEKFEHPKQVAGQCVLAGCPTAHRAKSLRTQQLVIRTALDVSACV